MRRAAVLTAKLLRLAEQVSLQMSTARIHEATGSLMAHFAQESGKVRVGQELTGTMALERCSGSC